MTAMGGVVPAGSAGGEALRSMLHSLVDQIFEERLRTVPGPRELPDLRWVARTIYDLRRLRSKILPRALLGEPAWDMLLDLFANDSQREGLTTKSVCVASDVPYSTAWRCLGTLEADGLIERLNDTRDGRRSLVRLTDYGDAAVRKCLHAAAAAPATAPQALALA